jgi:hypothetical protein
MPHPALASRRRAALFGRAVITAVSAVTALAGAAACASAATYNPDNLPTARIDQIGAICQSVVGLEPGERHYVDCMTSLSHSAWKLDRVRGMQDARDACLKKGLHPGEVALSECELQTFHSATLPTAYEATTPGPRAAKSYFYASTREIRNREQQACAEIGYDPLYGPFTDCVANLQGALFGAEHPMD